MIVSISEQAQSIQNYFPFKTRISTALSARNFFEGRLKLEYNTISLKLGAYVQLYEGGGYTQHSRSVGAITLKTSNKSGMLFNVPKDWTQTAQFYMDIITHHRRIDFYVQSTCKKRQTATDKKRSNI